MRSYLLKEIPDHLAALAVEGYHKPGSLTQASGAWIHSDPGQRCVDPLCRIFRAGKGDLAAQCP